MSADNWTYCPRCHAAAKATKRAREQAASDAYGKVDTNQFLALLDATKKPTQLEQSLREDYEFYMTVDGKFTAWYSASCDCGFEFQFNHEQEVKP